MATPLNIYELDKFNPYDFFIPLTFSINDFRDISTRNGTYSKTVKIPGTKKNDSLLGHSFKINAEGFFDRNQRVPAIIEKDGIRYLDGSMQLKSVDISDGKNWVYNIILYSDLSDWGSLIKDKNIRDLNYDTFTYNSTNIESSWSNNGRDNGYTFPLINYGEFASYPTLETTNTVVEDFLPSVFVYDVFRKIFRDIGYTLKPGFFARQEYRDLIMPSVLTETTSSKEFLNDNRATLLAFNESGIFLTDQSGKFNQWTSEIDPSNNISNFYYVIPFPDGTFSGNVSVIAYNMQNLFDNDVTFTVSHYSDIVTKVADLDSETLTIVKNAQIPGIFSLSFENVSLPDGHFIMIEWSATNSNTNLRIGGGSSLNQTGITFNITPTFAPLAEGSEISIKDFVYDMRQDSFIKYFIQMFNLVHVTDDRAKTVEFFHRDDFYKPIEDAEDWSEKIDVSKTQTIEQLDEKLNRDLVFEYESDNNDEDLVAFKDTWNTTLTDDTRRLDNEFLKDEKKVASVRFAGSVGGNTISQTAGGSLYLPQLVNNFRTPDEDIELEPRVLIYDGLQNGNFTFETVLKTQYPASYFIKSVSRPFDVSLSFKNLNEVSSSIQNNDVGLIDRHYRNQIRQFNNARLYTAYMRLTGVDIVNLDFRKPKLINGVYYYLNKVEDYKAGVFESVKCEFIQIV
jgi:hypothetical protein